MNISSIPQVLIFEVKVDVFFSFKKKNEKSRDTTPLKVDFGEKKKKSPSRIDEEKKIQVGKSNHH